MSQYEDLKARMDRIERNQNLILDQLAGPERAENGLPAFTGWPQLGDRTVVDFMATLGDKAGVPQCTAIDSHEHGTEEDGDTPCREADDEEGA